MVNICTVLASILIWLVLSVTVVPFLLVVCIFRFFVSKIIPLLDSNIDKILEPGNAMLWLGDKGKQIQIAVIYGVDGNINLQELKSLFYSRVILKKNSKSELFRPEMQQFIVSSCGFPFWKWDPSFNVDNHIHLLKIDPLWDIKEKSAQEILEVVEKNVMRSPFTKHRSPWQLIIVPNFRDTPLYGSESEIVCQGTILIFRLHHALGDGTTYRSICQDLFAHHGNKKVNDPVTNPVTLKSSALKSGLQQKLKTYFFGPWNFLMVASREQKIYESYIDASPNPVTSNANIAVTPTIPLEFIKDIRRSQGVSFTAVILSALAKAYTKFVKTAGHDVPRQLVCISTRGVPNHSGNMTNRHTMVHSEVPLLLDGADLFKTVETSLIKDIKSTNPEFNFELGAFVGRLPNSWREKIFGNVGGALVFTNSPFSEHDVWLNEGSNRLRTVFGLGMADNSALANNPVICLTSSCKDGVRFTIGINECIVSKDELKAEVFVQYFMEQLEKWSTEK